jgi:hypothetical protein
MSSKKDDDSIDPLLPNVDQEIVSTGAAADSSSTDEQLKGLPRILRIAVLAGREPLFVHMRIAAEVDELCPHLPLNATWSSMPDVGSGIALATELDHRAVTQDQSELRSLADCVRLISLPVPRDYNHLDDHRRVAKALLRALGGLPGRIDSDMLAELEAFCFGWAALPASIDLVSRHVRSAAAAAEMLGGQMAKLRIEAAEAAIRYSIQSDAQERAAEAEGEALETSDTALSDANPKYHVVVARLDDDLLKNSKLREIIGPLKSIINTALPLVSVPPLYEVRQKLVLEFPYAAEVIDFVLLDLVGKSTVRLRPLLIQGPPGCGKKRLVRILARELGLSDNAIWRVDSSQADGSVFGGTDRRWHSAGPCHPLLAIARAQHAGPLILLGNLDRAPTRNEYGRLWDSLASFLDHETSHCYPDPAIQIPVDLSKISYVATAHSTDPLPWALKDRFRIVSLGMPKPSDLDALLPNVIADLMAERGLDQRWAPSLDDVERKIIGKHWRGGSIRYLRRVVEAVLRDGEARKLRN